MTNITFGQYFPTNSIIHRLDPRTKILSAIGCIITIFLCKNAVNLALMSAFVLTSIKLSDISVKIYLKSLKMVLFVVIVTSVLNVFYGQGEPIFQLGFMCITLDGIKNSIYIAVRIFLLILVSSLLTFTTSPTDLTDGLGQLLKFLYKFKINVYDLAMMMSIALRFIPTLLEETTKITNAQKARGADLESGNLKQRIKALIPILVPLFVSAFRRAYDLAVAMECRCYIGGKTRTRMKILKFKPADMWTFVVLILLFSLVLTANLVGIFW
ncbi:MAG: energy-coupling factor transporter transmembrane component T [Clostridia bacterium]|nr:energy-coupling factor transporter transmembrane component T [Clostridia bacterium]